MYHSLYSSDHITWPLHPDYNPVARVRLAEVYQLLEIPTLTKRPSRQAAERALQDLRSCTRLRLSPPQRLCACFAETLAWSVLDQPIHALRSANLALTLAFERPDYSALIDLFSLRGGLNYSLLCMGEALDDYLRALEIMGEFSDVTAFPSQGHEDAAALSFQVIILSQIASLLLLLTKWRLAEGVLHRARHLLEPLPNSPSDLIRIAYIQAHLDRWKGHPELALGPSVDAIQLFEANDNIASAARAHIFAAEAALDSADRVPEGRYRAALITRASEHTDRALAQARTIRDPNALELGLLLQTRRDRYIGRQAPSLGRIETVVLRGNEQRDIAVLAQGWTALGDELAARADEDNALNAYRRVLALVDKSGLPALGIWARRALERRGYE